LARSSPIAGIQDEYIRQSARRMGDQDAIKELEEKGASVRGTLLFKFGGEIHNAKSFMPLLMTGLAAPEYSLRDARNIPKGGPLYSRHFVYNSISGELMDVITQVDIPVYFFTGRYDYTDPFMLREQYFSKINAPEKHIVWFEESAHFPFYEEPAAFARQMRGVLNATSPTRLLTVGIARSTWLQERHVRIQHPKLLFRNRTSELLGLLLDDAACEKCGIRRVPGE